MFLAVDHYFRYAEANYLRGRWTWFVAGSEWDETDRARYRRPNDGRAAYFSNYWGSGAKKIEKCESCGIWHEAGVSHICKIGPEPVVKLAQFTEQAVPDPWSESFDRPRGRREQKKRRTEKIGRKAYWRGFRAQGAGRPRLSPYLMRDLNESWLEGWDAGERASLPPNEEEIQEMKKLWEEYMVDSFDREGYRRAVLRLRVAPRTEKRRM